jgi:hypothetical protein
MNAVDKTANVERGIAEMVEAQTKPPPKIDKNFAAPEPPREAPDQGGILQLIDQTTEMLELSLRKMRLARQLLGGKP